MIKKILIISRDFPPMYGGVSVYTFEIFKRLSKEYDVKVLTTGHKKSEKNIFRIVRSGNSTLVFALLSIIKSLRENFDLIFATTYFHAIPGIFLKIIKRKPLITTIHDLGILETNRGNFLIRFLKYFSHRISAKLSDVILAPSERVKRQIVEKLRVDSKKIKVIPNGYNKEIFSPKVKYGIIRKKLNIAKNKKVILTSGLYPKKGIEYILEACGILKNRFKFENFVLIIIGDKDERFNWYYKKLDEIIKKFNLEDQVKFVGSVSWKILPFYYKDCDVYVAASYYGEGFGLPLIEAKAIGKPVIATKIFEECGTIINGKTGIVVEMRNALNLSNALIKILKNNKLRKKLGKEGIKFSKNFDWEEYLNEFKKILKNYN